MTARKTPRRDWTAAQGARVLDTQAKAIKTALSRNAPAAEAIGPLVPGIDKFVLTFGQFSLINGICHVLDQTGPAHVTIATWVAATADMRLTHGIFESGAILSIRWMIDRNFPQREPAYYRRLCETFGPESIRTLKSHAKFVTIRNDTWQIAFLTSANLNYNPRLEYIHILQSPELVSFLDQVADAVFRDHPPAAVIDATPPLNGIPDQTRAVTMGTCQIDGRAI